MTFASLITSLVITILPPGAMTLGGVCGEIGGVYYIETKEIIVCNLGDGNIEFYRNHEVAHYVWYEMLTPLQRKEYTSLYEVDKKKGLKAFYREYSIGDVEEDFADNLALLTTKESINNKYVKKRMKKVEYYLRIN